MSVRIMSGPKAVKHRIGSASVFRIGVSCFGSYRPEALQSQVTHEFISYQQDKISSVLLDRVRHSNPDSTHFRLTIRSTVPKKGGLNLEGQLVIIELDAALQLASDERRRSGIQLQRSLVLAILSTADRVLISLFSNCWRTGIYCPHLPCVRANKAGDICPMRLLAATTAPFANRNALLLLCSRGY